MLQGLDIAAAGMKARLDQQDIIANNLANANTPGYRRKVSSFSTFQEALQNSQTQTTTPFVPGRFVVSEDPRPGTLTQTGLSSDIALDGPGFLVAQTTSGAQQIRGGRFHVNTAGLIVTADGSPLLGQNGPIKVGTKDWTVDRDGSIRSDGKIIDKFKINADATAGSEALAGVVSGQIEGSDVNVVEEMVNMISVLRAYEMCQKSIQATDETLDKVINQMQK